MAVNMANGTSVIFAYGFRNPQGISWRPVDGQPFLVEHGADRDDEITPIVARWQRRLESRARATTSRSR